MSDLSRRGGLEGGNPFARVEQVERGDGAQALARAVAARAGRSLGAAAAAAAAGGGDAQAGELGLRGARDRVAVGLAGGEHVPGDRHELG